MSRLGNRSVHITVDLPEKVSNADVAQYVLEALEQWGPETHDEGEPLRPGLVVRKIKFNGEDFDCAKDDVEEEEAEEESLEDIADALLEDETPWEEEQEDG